MAEKGIRSLNKFRGDSKVSTWFYKIAENECKRELRRLITTRKRYRDLESIEPGSKDWQKLGRDADRVFEAQMVGLDAKSAMGEAFSVLPQEQREVALLRLQGFSFQEIATKTGVSPGTAANFFRPRQIRPQRVTTMVLSCKG
jgi:RNA polymerase sigma-70 factor (ECF subfamily)